MAPAVLPAPAQQAASLPVPIGPPAVATRRDPLVAVVGTGLAPGRVPAPGWVAVVVVAGRLRPRSKERAAIGGVIDGQDLVGIISQGDIALALSATETAETVEAISR